MFIHCRHALRHVVNRVLVQPRPAGRRAIAAFQDLETRLVNCKGNCPQGIVVDNLPCPAAAAHFKLRIRVARVFSNLETRRGNRMLHGIRIAHVQQHRIINRAGIIRPRRTRLGFIRFPQLASPRRRGKPLPRRRAARAIGGGGVRSQDVVRPAVVNIASLFIRRENMNCQRTI